MGQMNRCEAPHGTCIAPIAHPGREVPMVLLDADTVTCPACDAFERAMQHAGYAPDDLRLLAFRLERAERGCVTPDELASVLRESRRVIAALSRKDRR